MTWPLLIAPRDLPGLLATAPDAVVLDARPDKAAYGAGHLEGAIHADLNTDLSRVSDPDFDPAIGGRHPLPPLERWTRTLGRWGIGPETPVVLYDDSDGSNAATRAWWMLRSAGHEKVALLDGGLQAAVAEGLPLSVQAAQPAPREPYPAGAWRRPTVDMHTVDKLRTDPDWKVLDVRSTPRFLGRTEPIDPIAGHIPGAVNLPFALNLDETGRFKSAEALRGQYEALLDGTDPERLIVHCGSGVTACHTLFDLELAGLQGASLYVGSWSEWCRRDMPRGTGDTD